MVYKFFDKKAGDTSSKTRTGISENQELSNELHKPITGKFQRRKMYLFYRDKIWGANLADMELIR